MSVATPSGRDRVVGLAGRPRRARCRRRPWSGTGWRRRRPRSRSRPGCRAGRGRAGPRRPPRSALSASTMSSAAPFENWSRAEQRRLRARDHRPGDGLHRDVGPVERVLAVRAVRAVADRDGRPSSRPRRGPSRRPRRWSCPVVALPSTLTMMSPARRPAFSAGLSLNTVDDQRTAVLGRVDRTPIPTYEPDRPAALAARSAGVMNDGVAGVADGLGHALDRARSRAPGRRAPRGPRTACGACPRPRGSSANSLSGADAGLGVAGEARPPCRPRSRR